MAAVFLFLPPWRRVHEWPKHAYICTLKCMFWYFKTFLQRGGVFPLQAHRNGLYGRCNELTSSIKVGYVLSSWATFSFGGRAPPHVVNNESTEFVIPDSWFMPYAFLRQVHSLFQSQFSTDYNLVIFFFQFPVSSRSFPKHHPVAASVFFLVLPSRLSCLLSFLQ